MSSTTNKETEVRPSAQPPAAATEAKSSAPNNDNEPLPDIAAMPPAPSNGNGPQPLALPAEAWAEAEAALEADHEAEVEAGAEAEEAEAELESEAGGAGVAPKMRDHSRQYGLGQSARQFRLDARRLHSLVQKQMARLPSGSFQLRLSCLGRGAGRHAGSKALTYSAGGGHLEGAGGQGPFPAPPLGPPPTRATSPAPPPLEDSDVSVMPGNAERRAKKLRGLLKLLWGEHVAGTAWDGCRQMYRAVKAGAPPFPWWEAVAQCPFENSAIGTPTVSRRVYQHAAPLALALIQRKASRTQGVGEGGAAAPQGAGGGGAGDAGGGEVMQPAVPANTELAAGDDPVERIIELRQQMKRLREEEAALRERIAEEAAAEGAAKRARGA